MRKFQLVGLLVVSACFSTSPSHTTRREPATPKLTGAELVAAARKKFLGDGGPIDRAGGFELLEKACRTGVSEACVAVNNGSGGEGDDGPTTVLFEQCTNGQPKACRLVARVPVVIAARWCPKGASSACTVVAEREGDQQLMAKACHLGDPDACLALPSSTAETTIKAFSLLIRSCESGVQADCWKVAKLSAGTKLESAAQQAASDLAVRDCLDGDPDSCVYSQHATGDNELLVKRTSCGVDPSACRALAEYYVSHSDRTSAAETFEYSCLSHVEHSDFQWRVLDCVDAYALLDKAQAQRAERVHARGCELDKLAEERHYSTDATFHESCR